MRRLKLLITIVVALGLLCFFTISTASAQPPLDGLWFKLNGQATDFAVDPTGHPERNWFRDVAYLGLAWDNFNSYNYVLYTEQAPDVWAISTNGTMTPILEYYFPDVWWEHWYGDGPWVELYHTAVITPTYRGFRYQGWGEVVDGNDGAGNTLYGGITITGTSIDPSRLPFVP